MWHDICYLGAYRALIILHGIPVKESSMDALERLELSICITLGVIVFSNTLYTLCTMCPGDVLELAKFALP
jgi:hypothetical protein